MNDKRCAVFPHSHHALSWISVFGLAFLSHSLSTSLFLDFIDYAFQNLWLKSTLVTTRFFNKINNEIASNIFSSNCFFQPQSWVFQKEIQETVGSSNFKIWSTNLSMVEIGPDFIFFDTG